MAVSARSALSGVEKDRPSRIMQQKERKVKPEASCLSRPARGEGTGLGAENAKHVQPCAATGRFPGPPCTAVLAKWYRALGLLWRSANVHEVPVTWLPPSALVSQRGRVTFTSGALPRARGFKRREPPGSWSASGAGSKKTRTRIRAVTDCLPSRRVAECALRSSAPGRALAPRVGAVVLQVAPPAAGFHAADSPA